MGVVYKARDIYLDKDVAIKMLLIPNIEPAMLARFHREAKVASNLSHANIVSVFDFGVMGDGNPYMVMEYIEGETLDSVIEQEGPLSVDQSISVFMQICHGLAHAHKKGIIHRDLKPSNVILTVSDTRGALVNLPSSSALFSLGPCSFERLL